MAWYYGTYSCKHDGRTNICGPMKKRQYIADKHFEGLCPDCFDAKLKADREKELANAKAKADKMELPSLCGTAKQISWAETIRISMIESLDSLNAKNDIAESGKIFLIN